MRVATYKDDPGFAAWEDMVSLYGGADVTLDGSLVSEVVMADEELGEIIRAKQNAYGELYVIGDEVATETLKGMVKIIPRGSAK